MIPLFLISSFFSHKLPVTSFCVLGHHDIGFFIFSEKVIPNAVAVISQKLSEKLAIVTQVKAADCVV